MAALMTRLLRKPGSASVRNISIHGQTNTLNRGRFASSGRRQLAEGAGDNLLHLPPYSIGNFAHEGAEDANVMNRRKHVIQRRLGRNIAWFKTRIVKYRRASCIHLQGINGEVSDSDAAGWHAISDVFSHPAHTRIMELDL